MEDSSFLQWAINTLDQHTFPAATSPVYDIDSFHCGEHTADAFPLQQELRTAPQPLPGDNRDSSSGDVAVYAAVARPSTPISWKSSAALTQSATRGGRKHARARTSGSSLQGSATSSTSPDPARDHVIAERDRREKINQRLMELSSLIPGLKKMNKATIIEDAVKHVRELHEKVKILENNNTHAATTTICSAVLVHKNRPYLGGAPATTAKLIWKRVQLNSGGDGQQVELGTGSTLGHPQLVPYIVVKLVSDAFTLRFTIMVPFTNIAK
ncbi:Transcription factor bHLH25 [Hordeum vulgare]|nr:Transcription factor bHLH25 [Hordeum vulgare]